MTLKKETDHNTNTSALGGELHKKLHKRAGGGSSLSTSCSRHVFTSHVLFREREREKELTLGFLKPYIWKHLKQLALAAAVAILCSNVHGILSCNRTSILAKGNCNCSGCDFHKPITSDMVVDP